MTANVNGTESGIRFSRLCVIVGVIGGVLTVLHPLLGAALSVLALVWAIAGQRSTGQHAYRIALLVSLAALVMNIANTTYFCARKKPATHYWRDSLRGRGSGWMNYGTQNR